MSEYVKNKLDELNEKIESMSDEELKYLLKNSNSSISNAYDYLCEHVLGLEESQEELAINSPEFLRQA